MTTVGAAILTSQRSPEIQNQLGKKEKRSDAQASDESFIDERLAAHHAAAVPGTTWRDSTPLESTKLSWCRIPVDSRAVSSGATTLLRCCTTPARTLSGTTLFGAKIPAELLIW